MTSHVESAPPGAYAILELLAAQAPPAQVEEFVRRSCPPSADGDDAAELVHAGELAQGVHALIDRRRQREARLAALVDAARSLALPADLETVLETATRRARLLLNAEIAYISLLEREAGYSEVRAADGHSSPLTLGYRVGLDRESADAFDSPGAFWSPDYPADDRVRHSAALDGVVRAERLRGLIAVRLRHEGATFATLYTADRGVRHFSPDEVSLATTLGDLAAAAVWRARAEERARADLAAAQRRCEAHGRLVALALSGCALDELVAEAAALLGGDLLVRDPADGSPIAPARTSDPDEPGARHAALEASRAAHAEHRLLRLPDGAWVAPVAANGEALAIMVLRPAAPVDEHAHDDHARDDNTRDNNTAHLLELAAQAVAIPLLVRQAAARADVRPRDELLDLLIAADPRPPHELTERARRICLDLHEPFVIAVAKPEGGAHGRAALWASSYAHRSNGLKTLREGSLVFLLPGTDPGAAARTLSAELGSVLAAPVTVGASGPADAPGAARAAYREAVRCLDALTLLGCVGSAGSPRDMGFLGLLLSDDHDVDGFIESCLGPVLDYDRARRADLVRTLDAYFASGCSPTHSAEALHMHPNTVSRRLARINELLGPDWQRPARAMEIQLALRLRRTRDLLTGRR